jgi:hypothetical protein
MTVAAETLLSTDLSIGGISTTCNQREQRTIRALFCHDLTQQHYDFIILQDNCTLTQVISFGLIILVLYDRFGFFKVTDLFLTISI